ncbi:hypothetical protein LTS10_008305 [Elasticomyces elasticus]|nr:hypothetical protein LTS10_008305 [Elasticomyces elasticus]
MGFYQDISHITTGALGIAQVGTGNRLYLRGQTREARRAAEHAACLKAVCPDIDPEFDLSELRHERNRSPGTCEWLLKSDKIVRWLISEGEENLWLTGPPGIGKTTISVFLAEAILEIQKTPRALLLERIPETICMYKDTRFAYFFCTERQHRDNIVVVLQGLLLQLLRQDKALLEITSAIYQQRGDTCFGSVEGLWNILREVFRNSTDIRVYFLIDALDMCLPDSRKAFFALLSQVADEGTTRNIRWLITCRAEEDITRVISDGCHGERLELQTGVVSDDLKHYLTRKIDDLVRIRGFSPELKHRIGRRLQANSEGTFLWVSLVLQDLEGCTKAEASELLEEALPTELPDIYAKILGRIKPRRKEQAIFLLHAVTTAFRPLNVMELAAAFFTRGSTWHDSRHIHDVRAISDHADGYGVCLPIVHLDILTEGVNLIHKSVKDYLFITPTSLGHRSLAGEFGFSVEAAHHTMFTICWRVCLNTDHAIESRPISNMRWNSQLESLKQHYKHLAYFWDFVFEHAYASVDMVLATFPEEDLRNSPYLCDYWLRDAVSKNIPSIVQRLLAFNVDACALMKPMETSAMSIGIVRKDLRLIRKFLSHARTKESPDIYQAVIVAIEQGRHDIVQLLLPQRQVTTSPGFPGLTAALRAASAHDMVGVFETLLRQAKVDVNEQDSEGCTLLMQTVADEHRNIIEVLLKTPELDLNFQDRQGCSALSIAAKKSSWGIVDLLLTHAEVDVNTRDRWGNTPLAHAVFGNAMQVVRVLLNDERLKMDARDNKGRTPLMKATANGNHRMVRILLEKTILTGHLQISEEDHCGLSAPAWADAWSREFPAMPRMLPETGITPQATDYENAVWICRQQIRNLSKMSQLCALDREGDRYEHVTCDRCASLIGPLLFESHSSRYCQECVTKSSVGSIVSLITQRAQWVGLYEPLPMAHDQILNRDEARGEDIPRPAQNRFLGLLRDRLEAAEYILIWLLPNGSTQVPDTQLTRSLWDSPHIPYKDEWDASNVRTVPEHTLDREGGSVTARDSNLDLLTASSSDEAMRSLYATSSDSPVYAVPGTFQASW